MHKSSTMVAKDYEQLKEDLLEENDEDDPYRQDDTVEEIASEVSITVSQLAHKMSSLRAEKKQREREEEERLERERIAREAEKKKKA